jgi:hypothetical protein
MFIFIMDDGEIYYGETVSDDDKVAAEDGILDIVDCETKSQYYNGEWNSFKKWGE